MQQHFSALLRSFCYNYCEKVFSAYEKYIILALFVIYPNIKKKADS